MVVELVETTGIVKTVQKCFAPRKDRLPHTVEGYMVFDSLALLVRPFKVFGSLLLFFALQHF